MAEGEGFAGACGPRFFQDFQQVDLDQHAKEFLAQQANLPANITLVIDPDYTVTNLYGLRLNAPHETAYPSTFILAPDGRVTVEKISREHGDRTSATSAVKALQQ